MHNEGTSVFDTAPDRCRAHRMFRRNTRKQVNVEIAWIYNTACSKLCKQINLNKAKLLIFVREGYNI